MILVIGLHSFLIIIDTRKRLLNGVFFKDNYVDGFATVFFSALKNILLMKITKYKQK